MNYYWQLTQSDSLAEIKKECYLSRSCPINAKRMLLFMIEQVFLPMGEFGWCIMQIHNHSWGGGGGEEAKGQSFFFLFRATPSAYGSSQARGQNEAVAAGHSHSNARSEQCLWPTPQVMAMSDPLAHWERPGIKSLSSWILVSFVLLSHDGNSPNGEFI